MEGFKKIELPSLIPVLPVRNTVLFPNAGVPLIVGRPKSVQAIKQAQNASDLLLVVTQKDGNKEDPSHADLYNVGVVCLLSKITQVENESFQLIANGLFRFRIVEFVDCEGYLGARGIQMPDLSSQKSSFSESLANEIKQLGKSILALASVPGSDALVKLFGQLQDPEHVADLCCTFVNLPMARKQFILEMDNLDKKLQTLLDHMVKEKEKLVLQNEIQSKMMERLTKDQRDHLLREQLRTIHEELGEESNFHDDFLKRLDEAGLSADARKIAKDELARLGMVQRASPEYHVIRTYLEWLVSLPWQRESAAAENLIDLKAARQILDDDHFGIEKVKKRILQFLAVAKLKKDLKGPILCLLGPPGVGKTSVGKSIARALGKAFVRTSVGGIRDEAEIRGHRRTYVGAMPGRIIQSLKRSGYRDPVMMLDEIDKIGNDFRGDPASALLEVLDPEQNSAFVDHYIDVAFDLSRVFFIATANVIESIPAPLRDRMEVIQMTSYSNAEKLEIALRHLVPKLLADHGIREDQVSLSAPALETVIDYYTREAGVRNLTREIAHLCRASAEDLAGENPPPRLEWTAERVADVLGPRKFYSEVVDGQNRAGVVTGLAWTSTGGEILNIEVTRMEGKGSLLLTGQLGDIMKESAQIALSLLRSTSRQSAFRFDQSDFHIHVPAGAIPKDGPSAGVAIFIALSSLAQGKQVDSKVAMTGELTLRGTVLPVGGIKEKVLAAHRAGIEVICLPARNEGDLVDVSNDVRRQLRFHFIHNVEDLLTLTGLESPRPTPLPINPDAGHLITN